MSSSGRPARLLLCTDMDRTVIPNGPQNEHPQARARFSALCALPQVSLVYVSGRHLQLVEEAIATWQLPPPDHVITDVGTRIWQYARQRDVENHEWARYLDRDWHGRTHTDLQVALRPIEGLQLQEHAKQATHKLSYYLHEIAAHPRVLAEMHECLQQQGVEFNIIWSIDEHAGVGLIDVLPKSADKLQAIRFLQSQLGYADAEIVFAGDSGNDLAVLGSPVQAVLVGNATEEVRQAACEAVKTAGVEDSLYLAGSRPLPGLDSNYCAGILEGVWHFAPALRPFLEKDPAHD